MSQATDLIAEVKQSLTKVEKCVKNFERDIEQVGEFTDLAHLNIARIHLRELEGSLASRRENAENELEALTAPDSPTTDAAPAPSETPADPAPVVEAPASQQVVEAPAQPAQAESRQA